MKTKTAHNFNLRSTIVFIIPIKLLEIMKSYFWWNWVNIKQITVMKLLVFYSFHKASQWITQN